MATYIEIINENIKNAAVSWWPRYAFHYTDISNACNILKTGFLYSRQDAKRLNLMKNDNASRQVIEFTENTIQEQVRFYFRPLTPTQYHNEGFKHPEIRYDHDTFANVPVPVFLLFNLNSLLSMPKTRFSEMGLAGNTDATLLHNTPDEFEKFNFSMIYGNGAMSDPHEEIKYRHAEILGQNAFPIDSCLEEIVCRNKVERNVLLNLLRDEDYKTYRKYKDKVKISRNNLFYKNGFYITDYNYDLETRSFSLSYSETAAKGNYAKKNYQDDIDKLPPLKLKVKFDWVQIIRGQEKTIMHRELDFEADFNSSGVRIAGLPDIENASELRTTLYVEGDFIGYYRNSLKQDDIL